MRKWIRFTIVIQLSLVAALAAILSEPLGAERPVASRRTAEPQAVSGRVVEIRSYNLRPGRGSGFTSCSWPKRCRCYGDGRSMSLATDRHSTIRIPIS